MDTGYVTLSRQSGLMREMQIVANNVANAATTGYRQEGLIFSEHVAALNGQPALSMSGATAHNTSMLQGALGETGGRLDLAIEGAGFFLLDTPQGDRLTRAGSFTTNAEGELVNPDGLRVLDAGGAPIFVPPDATDLSVAADGTMSAGGRPLAQIGLYLPVEPMAMIREGGVLFRSEAGVEPSEAGHIVQGFLENSNVNAIGQVARMIEVQRAYELGQSFLDSENERLREAMKTLIK